MNFRERYRYDPTADKLGSGGFATVFRAEDILLEREVALKIFHVSESTKVNLLSELKRMSKLDHRNLIRCLDILNAEVTNVHGLTEKLSIGVMEYANGGSLKEFAHKNNDPETVKDILIQILRGLSYLHSKAIIHRDLKPQNILISDYDGELIPKISDFGISKSISAEDRSSSVVMGTIEYMAPEQFNPVRYGINGRISTNLDLWSFGILTYEVITKRHIFGDGDRNSSSEQVMNAILSFTMPEDIDKIAEPFQSVIRCCLVADANVRVKDAKELIMLLQKNAEDFIKPVPQYYDGETKLIRRVENDKIEIKPILKQEEKKIVEIEQAEPVRKTPFAAELKKPEKEIVPEKKPGISKKLFVPLAIIIPVILLSAAYFIFRQPATKENPANVIIATLKDTSVADKEAIWKAKIKELKEDQFAEPYQLFELYRDCAAAGIAECQYEFGLRQNKNAEYKVGFDMLTKAAAQNHVKAITELAYMYFDGVPGVVKKDKAQAKSLYERAAAADNSVALLMLGIIYKQGVGVEKDRLRANNYFRRVVQLADNSDAVSRANKEMTEN